MTEAEQTPVTPPKDHPLVDPQIRRLIFTCEHCNGYVVHAECSPTYCRLCHEVIQSTAHFAIMMPMSKVETLQTEMNAPGADVSAVIAKYATDNAKVTLK